MSDAMSRYLLSIGGGGAQLIRPGYLATWDPITGANTVRFSGTQVFTNLAYLGDPAAISVGRVLLLLTDGAPVILGRLTKP
jgi:hypothetical protein